MTRSKLGLKALGLCAMLVGVMAFASVAQAEPNAFWLVESKTFTTLAPPLVAEVDVPGTLLTELGGKFIHLTCATISLKEATLIEPLAKVLGKILFHGCKFWELITPGGTLKEVKACEPAVGANKGLIETNFIKGLIKLHEGKGSVEALPDKEGDPFATIQLGEECAFGEKITVEGVFFLRDDAFTTSSAKHLVLELAALTKLTVNKGVKKATIDGSAWAKLGGATHANKLFSGVPG